MLKCSTENVSRASNFQKPILTSKGEEHSVLREGIVSKKKLTSGSWLLLDKLFLFEKGLKLIDLKYGSGAILIQLNFNVAFSKWCKFILQNLLPTTVLWQATLPLSRCAFISFRNCLGSPIVSLLKSSFINLLFPFNLFTFCRIFNIFLYFGRLHIIAGGLFPLLVLFFLLDI